MKKVHQKKADRQLPIVELAQTSDNIRDNTREVRYY